MGVLNSPIEASGLTPSRYMRPTQWFGSIWVLFTTADHRLPTTPGRAQNDDLKQLAKVRFGGFACSCVVESPDPPMFGLVWTIEHPCPGAGSRWKSPKFDEKQQKGRWDT